MNEPACFLTIAKFRPILCLILHFHVQNICSSLSNDYFLIESPYFDDVHPRNVSAVVEETAILKCRVKNKGNRTVSWMRKRDLHILTTNIYTYTGDERFSVLHQPATENWDLKITYVQTRDTGIYECQVNTEPKINLAIMLEVTEANVRAKNSMNIHNDGKAPRAKILGSTEIHVKRDSTIALACSVNIHASTVTWYHGLTVVDFDSLRGGISLETEKTDSGTTSRLMLTRASFRDSGNYTCTPAGAVPASVRVHVLTGEQPAAMQTSGGAVLPKDPATLTLTLLWLFALQCTIISQATFTRTLFLKYSFIHYKIPKNKRNR